MIDTQISDGVAVVTMRHGKVNALDIEFCEALATRFKELTASREVKAVVLTGQGKAFSAGVNLLRLSEGGADYVRQFMPSLHKAFEAVFFHPKPVVAAVNGHAIAGGCVLACCGDRRVMARGAGRIGVTELLVGVPFPVLAFEIVRAAVPPRFLPEVLYSGATYEPAAASERGFIDEIAEPAELLEDAYAIAQELAALSPAAFAQTKAQIRESVAERVQTGAATEKAITDIWAAPDTLSYIRAYVERTLKKSGGQRRVSAAPTTKAAGGHASHAHPTVLFMKPLTPPSPARDRRRCPPCPPARSTAAPRRDRRRPQPSARRTIACAWWRRDG